MDRSQPGFSVHGILQARILEWVAMPSSRGCRYYLGSWCLHLVKGVCNFGTRAVPCPAYSWPSPCSPSPRSDRATMENQGQALRSAHGSRHTEGEEESVKEQRGLVSAALGRNADHRGRGSTQSIFSFKSINSGCAGSLLLLVMQGSSLVAGTGFSLQ